MAGPQGDTILPVAMPGPSEDDATALLAGTSAHQPLPATSDGIPDDFKYGTTVGQSDLSIRMAFVRKVYSILSMQIFATAVFAAVCMYSDKVQHWMLVNSWTFFVSWIMTLVSLVVLIVKRRDYPANMWALGAFTAFETYSIGAIVSMYRSEVVVQAALLTFGIFVALTLFTMQSKYDFSSMGPILFFALWGVILVSFIQIFLPFNRTFDLVIAVVTAIVFSGYIVYDTYNIMNRLSPEEYIIAAVELYLDVINLFLAILRILSNSDR